MKRKLTPKDIDGSQYQTFMYGVKKKAKWTCVICDWRARAGERIEVVVHHKNKNSTDHRLENLAVVCWDCHEKIHDKLLSRRRQKIVRERYKLTQERLAKPRSHRKYDEKGWPL